MTDINMKSYINALTLQPMAGNFNLNKKKYNMNNTYDNMNLNSNNFYIQEFDKIKDLATNMFIYEGLPEEIPEWYIESELFSNDVVFFKAEDDLYIVSPFTYDGCQEDHYGQPLEVRIQSKNNNLNNTKIKVSNVLSEVDESYGVIIRNSNTSNISPQFRALISASWFSKINRSLYVNLNNISVPLVVSGTPKTIKSMRKIFENVSSGEPVLYEVNTDIKGNDTIKDNITQLNMNSTYYGKQLMELQADKTNEYLSYLGINNSDRSKNERLLVDEVNANNQEISLMADTKLKAREMAVKVINKRFGLDIKVSLNNRMIEYAKGLYKDTDKSGVEQATEVVEQTKEEGDSDE